MSANLPPPPPPTGPFVPAAAPPPLGSNSMGVAGFVLSLASFATCGCLSPVALVVSLFGLRREPKTLAVAGVVLSLLGFLPLALMAAPFLVAFLGARSIANTNNMTMGQTGTMLLDLNTMTRGSEAVRVTDNNRPPRRFDVPLTQEEVRKYLDIRADLHARISADPEALAADTAPRPADPNALTFPEAVFLKHEAAALLAGGLGDAEAATVGARIYVALKSANDADAPEVQGAVAHANGSLGRTTLQYVGTDLDMLCRFLEFEPTATPEEETLVRSVAAELAGGLPTSIEAKTLLDDVK